MQLKSFRFIFPFGFGVLSGVIMLFVYSRKFVYIDGSSLILKEIPSVWQEVVIPRGSGDVILTRLDYASGDRNSLTLTIEGKSGEWLFLPCEDSYKVGFNSRNMLENISLVDVDNDMVVDGGFSSLESVTFKINQEKRIEVMKNNLKGTSGGSGKQRGSVVSDSFKGFF